MDITAIDSPLVICVPLPHTEFTLAQVDRARDYVATGTTALVDAKRTQKKTRKLQCCLLILVLVILIIIAVAVAVPVAINKG